MKLSKLLLTSTLVVAPVATIAPVIVSCDKKVPFKANTSTRHFTTSERTINIPLTFSYTPSAPVTIFLQGEGVESLICPSTVTIHNKKANLEINISGALSSSKLFKFDILFSYDAKSLPFTLKGFYIVYQFEPVQKDSIALVSPSIVETTDLLCTFKIHFSAEPTSTGGDIGTDVAIITHTTKQTPLQWHPTQKITTEGSQFYLYFQISSYGSLEDTYFFSTFDLILTFRNSYKNEQIEVIPNCVYTHLVK